MTNFEYLQHKPEYALFAPACIEAERIYATAPAMCAVGCRKALELAVKWVYAADTTMEKPYKDNLQSLIHEPSFRFAVDEQTWGKFPYIIRLGNLAVHTERSVSPADALLSLRGLFEFISWIDYCYGADYAERHFDEALIPRQKVTVDTRRIRQQEALLDQKDEEIEALRQQIAALSATYTAEKTAHQEARAFAPADITEFATRKRYIDVDLKEMGWRFDGPEADVQEEVRLEGLDGVVGRVGYADYVLYGRDGKPLAVVEAKRASTDPAAGRRQAQQYADCLERQYGQRPLIFTTNGFETWFWDDLSGPPRQVSRIFPQSDLHKRLRRRAEQRDLLQIPIDDRITNRYYQKAAIRAVCEQLGQGFRKHLLVMATGTGKTRTAASLVDVLSRGRAVTNVLFLADRTALVEQALDAFRACLPDMSLCNLCTNKDDRQARIVFSTYPTMHNAISEVRGGDGLPLFTPAHFDLIIIDESHRSIFKKYRAIFAYFDAILVGLTATPKTDVDRNTYDFFEMAHGVPTYAYDYETAVEEDHVLVPYYNYEVRTKFLDKGITYDELSDADKARYEEDFIEDEGLPDFIPSTEMNRFVFNEQTVDLVLQDLMTRGIKVAGGDLLGKTIIFAQNKRHADYIVERFNALYPHLRGSFAQRITCDDSRALSLIETFKQADRMPQIAVSVDMMDTGIDAPEVVNLVFFKKVRSKAKFWQMIGRGTRLCPGLVCSDQIDGEYVGKRRFLIFDYCGNFEFFRENVNGFETQETRTLSENIFRKRVRLMAALQGAPYQEPAYRDWREAMADACHQQVIALNRDLYDVRLQLRYVETYRDRAAFADITESVRADLYDHIAPLVTLADKDEFAKRFDNFMYGLMIAVLDDLPTYRRSRQQLCSIGAALAGKRSIPQVEARIATIEAVQSDDFWAQSGLLHFEEARQALRDLIKFLVGGQGKRTIFTVLVDPVLDATEGESLGPAYDFEDYRAKVNRYVNDHGDMLAIHKLTHNIPLTQKDYEELERVLTSELGSRADYEREYGDTPFGLLVRQIAKLDHDAAMAAFSTFINDHALNASQIAFVEKIIHYIETNGYMADLTELTRPPFDKPTSFIKLFDKTTRTALLAAINNVKANAVEIAVS